MLFLFSGSTKVVLERGVASAIPDAKPEETLYDGHQPARQPRRRE